MKLPSTLWLSAGILFAIFSENAFSDCITQYPTMKIQKAGNYQYNSPEALMKFGNAGCSATIYYQIEGYHPTWTKRKTTTSPFLEANGSPGEIRHYIACSVGSNPILNPSSCTNTVTFEYSDLTTAPTSPSAVAISSNTIRFRANPPVSPSIQIQSIRVQIQLLGTTTWSDLGPLDSNDELIATLQPSTPKKSYIVKFVGVGRNKSQPHSGSSSNGGGLMFGYWSQVILQH